jgi:[pyruvate, water dikinase]-phosphate phosphotransferase / [pyruvate, water dikinase] kinase
MLKVFLVSDATGGTGERLVRSAIVQFEDADVRLTRRPNVLTSEQVRAVVQEASKGDSLIVHTLVSDELRQLIHTESRLHNVDCLDVLGPMLARLVNHLGLVSQQKPGLFRHLEEGRTREIEAVAFAFRHDDGLNTQDLHRAEIVLVGVSRSMKTPTMLYLAYRGWFVANVPIIPELPLDSALAAAPAARVVCLTLNAEHLQQRRSTRAIEEGIPLKPYASLEQIIKENDYARDLCAKYGWQQIDVTGKAVEEVAREIITVLQTEEISPTGQIPREAS